MSDGRRYHTAAETNPSHVRLGFAALNSDELTQSVHIIEYALRNTPSSSLERLAVRLPAPLGRSNVPLEG